MAPHDLSPFYRDALNQAAALVGVPTSVLIKLAVHSFLRQEFPLLVMGKLIPDVDKKLLGLSDKEWSPVDRSEAKRK